ncbi:hypothetical protein [Delftia acidovorans]|uniref:hypothetical protein n=1 Tax=Delftia acidovorans TaxID=80866 RepID=UPI0028E6E6FA|nr:hypothetical protein [Delftia acidovorans]
MRSFESQIRALEGALVRNALAELIITIVILAALFWATYYVIKAGVRDGIREAGEDRRVSARPQAPPGYKWTLIKETATAPEMHAD